MIKITNLIKKQMKNKTSKIVILGSGESGTGAALLAKAKGYEVFVSDKGLSLIHI